MISEARLLIAALTGVGLTITLSNVFRDLGMALGISIPAALIMGGVMMLLASDNPKKSDDKSPKGR